METYLDDQRELKLKICELFRSNPDLLPPSLEGLPKEEHRALVRRQLHALLDAGHNPLELFSKDLKGYFKTGEVLALVDLSLMVKSGVQYSLWGGSVLNLGTERHRR
ncbi:acyl-coenzyme A oxidase, partial [Haematococcus lacustris]